MLHTSNREASASDLSLEALQRARGPTKLQGIQHLRHEAWCLPRGHLVGEGLALI